MGLEQTPDKDGRQWTDREYLAERLDDQIEWYDKKSGVNQTRFKRLRVAEILSAAGVTAAGSLSIAGIGWLDWVVVLLGLVASVSVGLITLVKPEELWHTYRATAEQLKHEKYAYLTRTGPYSGDCPLEELVGRVEEIISSEHTVWKRIQSGNKERVDDDKSVC